jgi:coronin-1B/1C/6
MLVVHTAGVHRFGQGSARCISCFKTIWALKVNFILHEYLLTIFRKVGSVLFHPTADNVLASTSGDYTLKLWNIVKESNQLTLKHTDIIQSLSFNRNGSALVTTCRDKKIRIWDPRMNQTAQEAPGHSGAKNSRVVFLNDERIVTTGFSKMSDRQLGLWDTKNLSRPLGDFTVLDQSAGVVMVFFRQT